jgi:hypothetical protein
MKRPGAEATINALALLAIAVLGAWLVYATEWVDVWRPTPPGNEAARDAHYAIKQIVTRLGGRVHAPDNLDRLPPPGATLVLESDQWDFVPGRGDRLREWVEQGGHLVLPSFFRTGNDMAWVPVQERKRKALQCPIPRDDGDQDEDDDNEREAEPAPKPPARPRRREDLDPFFVGPSSHPDRHCALMTQSLPAPTTGSEPVVWRICNGDWSARLEARPGHAATWSVDGTQGAHSLRVPLGQGRVTVSAEYGLLGNHSLFRGDHALLAVTALDLRPGQEVWLVMDEQREALAAWLWHRAGPAIALALLALAFALWRGMLRFGPLLPQAPAARRSVAEQIRGTAAFVLRGGGVPLVAAARRALDEAARGRIAGWDRMTMTQRIEALRGPTGLPAEHLTRALDPTLPPGRGRALADKLALIETARRRLAFNKHP